MAEYTPTTNEVREVWVQEQDITHGEGADFHAAEFDRFLAAYETELRERIAQDIARAVGEGTASDIARGATR